MAQITQDLDKRCKIWQDKSYRAGHICRNIPFSLAYRILRICSERSTMLQRLEELRSMLISRHYSPRIIQNAFDKICALDRNTALQKVNRPKENGKLTFTCKYDPRLPSISKIIQKHFTVMGEDPYLKRVFQEGCQVSYSRYKNLKETICRGKLFPVRDSRPKREKLGWKTCGKCVSCAHSRNISEFRCHATGEVIKIRQAIKCTDENLIYCIACNKCGMQYIGKTISSFRTRMIQHRNSIGTSKSRVALHFESRGHSSHNFECFAIEKVFGNGFVLAARERYYIDKLDVVAKGMNANRTTI